MPQLPLVYSEVRGRLPWPAVRRDGASWQRGAPQCGGVSVRLQGGPGLWRPGDSGLWHEGNASLRACLCVSPVQTERAQRGPSCILEGLCISLLWNPLFEIVL